jgi:hypothetical protein
MAELTIFATRCSEDHQDESACVQSLHLAIPKPRLNHNAMRCASTEQAFHVAPTESNALAREVGPAPKASISNAHHENLAACAQPVPLPDCHGMTTEVHTPTGWISDGTRAGFSSFRVSVCSARIRGKLLLTPTRNHYPSEKLVACAKRFDSKLTDGESYRIALRVTATRGYGSRASATVPSCSNEVSFDTKSSYVSEIPVWRNRSAPDHNPSKPSPLSRSRTSMRQSSPKRHRVSPITPRSTTGPGRPSSVSSGCLRP